MAARGKKYKKAREALSVSKTYTLQEGVTRVKELAYARFDESVDINVNLGIDASKGEQAVRGSVILPHGIGKTPVIVAFAKGDYAEAAKKAGADFVGAEDLIEKIENGWMDFTYAVATPDLMGLVGKVAKVLGPRGLLPNKKSGTVTFDLGPVVEDLRRGRLFFKNDKNGLVHFSCGRVSFPVSSLQENLVAFIRALASAKPSTSKGKFLRKVTISSTMGVGIPVNADEAL